MFNKSQYKKVLFELKYIDFLSFCFFISCIMFILHVDTVQRSAFLRILRPSLCFIFWRPTWVCNAFFSPPEHWHFFLGPIRLSRAGAYRTEPYFSKRIKYKFLFPNKCGCIDGKKIRLLGFL